MEKKIIMKFKFKTVKCETSGETNENSFFFFF